MNTPHINYYVFRQLTKNDQYKFVTTIVYDGDDYPIKSNYKIVRRDTTPQRLSFARMADGKQYSEYGGAVVAVYLDYAGKQRVGISICSTSDKFDINKGMELALDRASEQENPELPKDCKQIINAILNGSKKYPPVRSTVFV